MPAPRRGGERAFGGSARLPDVTLVALVAAIALGLAALSLVRLSRLPKALAEVPEDRTWQNLRAGDVVVTPDGDFLVESRSPIDGGELFALRSGRLRRFLVVPPDGAVGLLHEPPESARALGAAKGLVLDRSTVELLPGA